MSVEQGTKGKSVHSGPGQCGCGPDSEQAAKAEIERARKEIENAEHEIEHGVHDLEGAEAHLRKAEHDLERAHHDKVIRFFVDGEEFKTRDPNQTPDHIIKEYGGRDPAENYLVQIEGHKKISYQAKGDIPIRIEDCARFQIISVGPAPVSDKNIKAGVESFIAGLREAGHEPEIVPGKPNHVAFAYEVPSGSHIGKKVHIGVVVPPDFPMTPPDGPHVSPQIHAMKSGGDHPTGGISKSTFEGFRGQSWQYWSRPVRYWGQSKKTVAVYLSHLWKLWDTQ